MKLNELFKKYDSKYATICQHLIKVGNLAKEAVLDIYKKDFHIEIKSDNSPVTEADLKSNEIIVSYLKEHFPKFAILSEESSDDLNRLNNDDLFIIDPIDGTSDYVQRNGEFAINLAYCYKKEVKVGVIFIPVLNICYFAFDNCGSYKYLIDKDEVIQIHTSDRSTNLVQLVSRSHRSPGNYFEYLGNSVSVVVPCGSSYKGCQIAEGIADLYFSSSQNTKEWDVCPIDIIVRNAGGIFLTMKLERFTYNKENPYNLDGFVIFNNTNNMK